MENRYVILLDYIGTLKIIELTDDEIRESKNIEKYEDFDEFLVTLEEKYDFTLSNCNWMAVEKLDTQIYKGGKEVSNEFINQPFFTRFS